MTKAGAQAAFAKVRGVRFATDAAFAGAGSAMDGGGLLFALIVVGRTLGPADYGNFASAFAVVTVGFLLTDLGLAPALTRAVARRPSGTAHWFAQTLALRLLSVAVAIPLLTIVGGLAFPPGVARLVPPLAVAAGAIAVAQLWIALFRGRQDMRRAFTAIAGERIALAVIVVALAGRRGDAMQFAIGFATAALLRVVIAAIAARALSVPLRCSVDVRQWPGVMRTAAPLAVTGLLTMVAWRIDTILLSLLAEDGAAAVGVYNAAFTLFSAATLGGAAVGITLFPMFAQRDSAGSTAEMAALFEWASRGLLLLGAAVSVAVYVLAPVLIDTLFGPPFAPAVPLLRILAVALLFTHISFVIHAMLPAVHRTRDLGATLACAAAVNIVLNVVAIPRWGATAAALTTLVSEVVVACGGLLLARRYLRMRVSAPALT